MLSVIRKIRPGTWPELGLAMFLLVTGILVLVDSSRIPTSFAQRGPIGPAAVPTAIGIGLVVVSLVLTILVLRGHFAEPEDGEDVDVSHGTDWRTALLLGGSFLGNAVLMQPLGWPISGALLFWSSAFILGNRRYVRNAIIALVLSFSSYLLFSTVLGLELPAGPLEGLI